HHANDPGDFEIGQPPAGKVSQLPGVERGILTQYDGGADLRAETRMRDCEDHGLGHVRMAQQRQLDLGRSDLLSAPIDDIFYPADDEKVSILVQIPKVAGEKPPVAKGSGVGGRVFQVSPRDGGTSQGDLPVYAGGDFPAFRVEDCYFGGGGLSDPPPLASAQKNGGHLQGALRAAICNC